MKFSEHINLTLIAYLNLLIFILHFWDGNFIFSLFRLMKGPMPCISSKTNEMEEEEKMKIKLKSQLIQVLELTRIA